MICRSNWTIARQGRRIWIGASAIALSLVATTALSAAALVDLESGGEHPFPPYIIRLTSMVIAAQANTQAASDGDLISGNADGIDQGHYANCWFEATVGAVSRSRRGDILIARMIRRRGPASYFVNFPDAPRLTIPITKMKMKRDGLKVRR